MASERDALPAEIEKQILVLSKRWARLYRTPKVISDALHELVWAALALGREQGRQEEQLRRPIMVDRDADLLQELRAYLAVQTITSENIGDVRRALFVPWDSMWNGWVRDETAARENRAGREGAGR